MERKKIKVEIMMWIPKTDCLDIEKIGEDIHSALDEYGQIYGTSYDFDHEENLRASIDKSKRILELTAQLKEAKADYEAAVDAMDDLAMGIVCKHCKRDSSTCESGLVYSCARFEYRGRNKGNG
jgi:hypothetical protein